MTGWVFHPSFPLAIEAVVAALLGLVLLIGTVRRSSLDRLNGWLTLAGLLVALGMAWNAEPGRVWLDGTVVLDDLALFAKRLFLCASVLSVLASLAVEESSFLRRSTEYYVVMLASLLGMLTLSSARELVLLFVAFELMSIPLYFLTGFRKRDRLAPEGALKFFVVGSVSSAVILYGISFVYGSTGSTDLAAIAVQMTTGDPLLLLGLSLVLAGLGFKIAAVPFHMWVPDTYEAGSTPFVAWLSIAPKAAGFVVLIRVFVEGVGSPALWWVPAFSALAGVTIVAGNLLAIPQTNIKRLLAYSGVAHIGYLLLALASMSVSGIGMLLFYLAAYLFGNMGAFFVVQAVAQSAGTDDMSAYQGLARRSPALALALLLFLLSLGGIPFVAGFWAKLFVFWAAVEQGLYLLAFLGAVLTVVALYYYLVVSRRMYIEAPETPTPVPVPPALQLAIVICLLGIVVMGVYPQPWVQSCLRVALTVFAGV
jgi:NADH-quinone oxidoreductase subunit N